MQENLKTAVKSVTCGHKVLKPVTEAVLEKENHAKSKTVKTKSFSDKNTYNIVGGIKNKENVAIYANDSTDHIDIQSLLQVPDDKGLRVWTDKNMCWKTFKSDCFLVNDYEEPLK